MTPKVIRLNPNQSTLIISVSTQQMDDMAVGKAALVKINGKPVELKMIPLFENGEPTSAIFLWEDQKRQLVSASEIEGGYRIIAGQVEGINPIKPE